MINKTHNLPHVAFKFAKKGKGLLLQLLEHKRINKILAPNLALAIIAGSLLPSVHTASASQNFDGVIDTNKTPLTTLHGLQNPVEHIKINQGYFVFHPGVDLGGYPGEVIKPVMRGIVSDIQHANVGYGNAVIVDHGNGITSLYAHMSKTLVEVGQEVNVSTTLGLMGSTGHSTGTHLHLEIRDHKTPVNPLSIIPG